jgi:hypothetical protein
VTWVIILIIVVFDPLAIILLLSSQISFQKFREQEDPSERELQEFTDAFNEVFAEGDSPVKVDDNVIASQPTVTESVLDKHPYLTQPFKHFENVQPVVAKPAYEADDGPLSEQQIEQIKESVAPVVITPPVPVSVTVSDQSKMVRTKVFPRASVTVPLPEEYVQNEEQRESNLWTSTTQTPITKEEYVAAAQQRAKDNT